MANYVQLYRSGDLNAPVLSGTTGSLITLLNKCLVDGYTTASVSSITRSGSTATVTLAVANSTLLTGDRITIAGASQADYNGTFQITVTSQTTFTYTVANSPVTPATGTITYAKAGLQWTRPFAAGTNSQTYRSGDNTSNQFYLQVIDNGATTGGAREAQVYGAEVMSADQTVTSGRFPTAVQAASGLGWFKSSTLDSTARTWVLLGDDRTFYLWMYGTGVTQSQQGRMYGFGYFIPYKSGDGYNTFIWGESAFNAVANAMPIYCAGWNTTAAQSSGGYFARAYSQAGSAVTLNTFGAGWAGVPGNPQSYITNLPNLSDGGLYFMPLTCQDAGSGPHFRGRMPGMYCSLYPALSYQSIYDIVVVTQPSTMTLMGLQCMSNSGSSSGQAYYGMIHADIYGPWN